jgi:hypothetical protein
MHEQAAVLFSAGVTRLAAALLVSLALATSQIAFAFVTALAALIPSPPLLAAAGVSGLIAALLFVTGGADEGLGGSVAALCLVLAVCLLAMAWARRRALERGTDVAIAILIVCSVFALVAIGSAGLDLTRLHQSARAMPSAVVLLSALAAASWMRPSPAPTAPDACAFPAHLVAAPFSEPRVRRTVKARVGSKPGPGGETVSWSSTSACSRAFSVEAVCAAGCGRARAG